MSIHCWKKGQDQFSPKELDEMEERINAKDYEEE